ncbi:MAG TPA: hypothetical protein PLH70_01775 [Bacteroidales bacterium]|mgnify:CR=1 FL=1|nr:hypothetical protein [Bacteroidales bacterium]HOH22163.1 hypothetical protein [Bacteroidales bacterium]HPZ02588.1 hypothetical protein [Bacteroidales bacterium]HQB74513.1 hypothetical protein [Bacteroidales bacterium]
MNEQYTILTREAKIELIKILKAGKIGENEKAKILTLLGIEQKVFVFGTGEEIERLEKLQAELIEKGINI